MRFFDSYPTPEDISIARDTIKAGATIIFGHHPHVVQGVERFQDGIIFYSLGNFIFDYHKNAKWREGIVGECEISKSGIQSFGLYPFVIHGHEFIPEVLHEEDAVQFPVRNRRVFYMDAGFRVDHDA